MNNFSYENYCFWRNSKSFYSTFLKKIFEENLNFCLKASKKLNIYEMAPPLSFLVIFN